MCRLLIASAAVTITVLIGCGTGGIVPDSSSYFPLAIGNAWEYEGSGDDLSWTVTGYAKHDCGAALWSITTVSGDKEYTFYWRAVDDGLYEYIDT
ncbi:MAG: hypothetical protein JSW52_00710 [Candidatus Coatesbacteria bacterium]|nr:MAG: hypothetical protein JSW52_00710 [Candidatus Coatesbacteria bacterium]